MSFTLHTAASYVVFAGVAALVLWVLVRPSGYPRPAGPLLFDRGDSAPFRDPMQKGIADHRKGDYEAAWEPRDRRFRPV